MKQPRNDCQHKTAYKINVLTTVATTTYNINMMKNTLKQHIGYWINRIRTHVHTSFENRLQHYDVSVAQWCILVALYDHRAETINDLASYIAIDKGSISRVVEKLVTRGFILHSQGKDKRSGHLSLTEKGSALVPFLIEEAELNERWFFGALTSDEQNQLQYLINKIIRSSIPSIHLDGWMDLTNKLVTENISTERASKMTENQLQAILTHAKKTKQPYPITFNQLKEAGVHLYEVYLDSYKNIYKGTFGEWSELPPEGFSSQIISPIFNETEISRSIKSHQAGETTFIECLSELAKAGVSHYRVQMDARTVTYYDAREENSLQEHVPG